MRRRQPGASAGHGLRRRRGLAAGALAVALALIAWAVLINTPAYALRSALREELAAKRPPDPAAAVYAARGYQPIWVETTGVWPSRGAARFAPGARERASLVADAAGLRWPQPEPRAQGGGMATHLGPPRQAARVELALTSALVRHATAVAEARERELAFVDPAFPATPGPQEYLEWARFAPSAVADIRKLNPVYDALVDALAAYRRDWGSLPQVEVAVGPTLRRGDRDVRVRRLRARLGLSDGDLFGEDLARAVARFQAAHAVPVTGAADQQTILALNRGASHYERLITVNLQRAKGLPPPLGDRFILVNPAARQLWMYEGGRVAGSMKVIVGSRREQTPNMVGLIRYMVYNPYWEVPVDMVRHAIAPIAAREGPGYLDRRRMQVLSDWTDAATVVSPGAVDWSAVAAGRAEVRLRQAPGPGNAMGAMKFMMPNELGIYLHDTPDKAPFGSEARQLSAGCIRLERARDLASWIRAEMGENPAFRGADEIVDEFSPVTVYVVYLTAAATPEGVRFYPDVYGRDGPRGGPAQS